MNLTSMSWVLLIWMSCWMSAVVAKRTTTPVPQAYRHAMMDVNWTAENIMFQEILNAKGDETWPTYRTTHLPTLKYQRGVNLTAYEINIRKEQARIDVELDARRKSIDKDRAKADSIKAEMKQIRLNMSAIKKVIQKNASYSRVLTKKNDLVREYKRLLKKYNVSTAKNNTFAFHYETAKIKIAQMIRGHVKMLMNRTKYLYDYVLRKSEVEKHIQSLEDNITALDEKVNEELEQEYVAPNVKIVDILQNLSRTVQLLPTKFYKYKRARRGFKHISSVLKKFLNLSKTLTDANKVPTPPEVKLVAAQIRNLTSLLRISDAQISRLKKMWKEKDDEYEEVYAQMYNKTLYLHDVETERFVWEMNLTNFLKETVRKDLIEAYYTPDIDFFLRDQSSLDVKDNVFLEEIREHNYYKHYVKNNQTTTFNYEYQQLLNLDKQCRQHMHDNWFSFEHYKTPAPARKKRKKRAAIKGGLLFRHVF